MGQEPSKVPTNRRNSSPTRNDVSLRLFRRSRVQSLNAWDVRSLKPPCWRWQGSEPLWTLSSGAFTVNAEEQALRTNRLRLLSALRRAMLAVADFSRIVEKN